jgi:membrane associated rhomboid family serine protease
VAAGGIGQCGADEGQSDCNWLHAGLIHLVVNLLSLLFIGIRLEQQFGFGKLLK